MFHELLVHCLEVPSISKQLCTDNSSNVTSTTGTLFGSARHQQVPRHWQQQLFYIYYWCIAWKCQTSLSNWALTTELMSHQIMVNFLKVADISSQLSTDNSSKVTSTTGALLWSARHEQATGYWQQQQCLVLPDISKQLGTNKCRNIISATGSFLGSARHEHTTGYQHQP